MIAATRDISASPDRVYAFLSDLRNHWRLEDHFVELADVATDGARVRVRGPLGISRTARTTVEEAVPHSRLRGRAELGRTVGRVAWDIAPAAGPRSRVSLSARVERAGALDRMLLAVGGRVYLRRIFARTLENLERELG